MKYTITYGSSQEVGLIGKGRFTEKKPFLITMFGSPGMNTILN